MFQLLQKMKIIHTADVHLGAKFFNLGSRGEDQRQFQKKTFEEIIKRAISEKIDIFLIAGDLFDSNHPQENLIQFVKDNFKLLEKENIPVAVIPGTHDCLSEDSIYFRENFGKNIFIFNNPDVNFKDFPELDLRIWAKPNTSNKSTKSPIPKIDTNNLIPKTYNLIMAHGSVQIPGKSASDDWPISFEEIENSGADYIALGHWHGAQEMSKGGVTAWYSGSPEITYKEGKGGLGQGYILLVEISQKGIRVESVKVSKKELKDIEIDISQIEDVGKLKEEIMKQSGVNNIAIFYLNGLRNYNLVFDVSSLEKELEDRFFGLKIIDKSQLKLEDIKLEDFPEELLTGQFLRVVKDKISKAKSEEEKEILEDVLQLGIAELEGKRII